MKQHLYKKYRHNYVNFLWKLHQLYAFIYWMVNIVAYMNQSKNVQDIL